MVVILFGDFLGWMKDFLCFFEGILD